MEVPGFYHASLLYKALPFVQLLHFLKPNSTSEQRLRIDHTPFSVARHSIMSGGSKNTGSNGEPLNLNAQLI